MKRLLGTILGLTGFALFFTSCSTLIVNKDIGGCLLQFGIAIVLLVVAIYLFIHAKVYGSEIPKKLKEYSNREKPDVKKAKDEAIPALVEGVVQEKTKTDILIKNKSSKERHEEMAERIATQLLFPNVYEDYTLTYMYDDVEVAGTKYQEIDYSTIQIGDNLKFMQEPDNKYDNEAILIFHESGAIGHVKRGIIQGMINDWTNREDLAAAIITEVEEDTETIKYSIAFYKKPVGK